MHVRTLPTSNPFRQADAVLAYLSGCTIEPSWDTNKSQYLAQIEVNDWVNGREHGYVVSMRSVGLGRQINVAFFEHRNTDQIVALKFELLTWNPPTYESVSAVKPPVIYKNDSKWDVDHTVPYGEAAEMADWVHQQLADFWVETAAA